MARYKRLEMSAEQIDALPGLISALRETTELLAQTTAAAIAAEKERAEGAEQANAGNIGDLTQLQTTTKTSLVAAVNEVRNTAGGDSDEIGRLVEAMADMDSDRLPLLCGQPRILFGAGTPQEAVVPDNWKQFDPETEEGYNWTGVPSALGQEYINTAVATGSHYYAVRDVNYGLKWIQ